MASSSRRLAISSLLCSDPPNDQGSRRKVDSSSIVPSPPQQPLSAQSYHQYPTIHSPVPKIPSSSDHSASFQPIHSAPSHFYSRQSNIIHDSHARSDYSLHISRPTPIITANLSSSSTVNTPLSGLDALVHVATEERERIYTNDNSYILGASTRSVISDERLSPLISHRSRTIDSLSPTLHQQPAVSTVVPYQQYNASPQPQRQSLPIMPSGRSIMSTATENSYFEESSKSLTSRKRRRYSPEFQTEGSNMSERTDPVILTTSASLVKFPAGMTNKQQVTKEALPHLQGKTVSPNSQMKTGLKPNTGERGLLELPQLSNKGDLEHSLPHRSPPLSHTHFRIRGRKPDVSVGISQQSRNSSNHQPEGASPLRIDSADEVSVPYTKLSQHNHSKTQLSHSRLEPPRGGDPNVAAKKEEEADVHDFFLSTISTSDTIPQLSHENPSKDIFSRRRVEREGTGGSTKSEALFQSVQRDRSNSGATFDTTPLDAGRATVPSMLNKPPPVLPRQDVETEEDTLTVVSDPRDFRLREKDVDIDADVDDELLRLLDDTPDQPQDDNSQKLRKSGATQSSATSGCKGLKDMRHSPQNLQGSNVASFGMQSDLDNTMLRVDVTKVLPIKASDTQVKESASVGDFKLKTGVTVKGSSKGSSSSRSSVKNQSKRNNDVSSSVEPFPNVSSSGRMITKSKKSMAADISRPNLSTSKRTSIGPGDPDVVVSGITSVEKGASQQKRKSASNKISKADLSRSRSHSVLHQERARSESHFDDTANVEETVSQERENDGDKLYCICRTTYDEERVMIACDRCDEWYHTQCVNMSDLDVDLVDQFICSICIRKNPHLRLQTTYKQRCLAGSMYSNPNSAEACHKPARGAFSKYCSDECGIIYMQLRIEAWMDNGGDIDHLWASLRDAKRREGVVVHEALHEKSQIIDDSFFKQDSDGAEQQVLKINIAEDAQMDSRDAYELRTLQTQLNDILGEREVLTREKGFILRRQELLQLAIQRVEFLDDECGWDQRLCFGDEEWEEFGDGVIESYECNTNEEDGGKVFSNEDVKEGEWWCRGKKRCDRHAGWQKLRLTEIALERELKESAIGFLTKKERDIRKKLEDIDRGLLKNVNGGCFKTEDY